MDAHLPPSSPAGTATAGFRFGMQVDAAQSPGAYTAPLTFEVVAPM